MKAGKFLYCFNIGIKYKLLEYKQWKDKQSWRVDDCMQTTEYPEIVIWHIGCIILINLCYFNFL